MTNLVVFLNLDVFACRFIGILFHFGFNFGAHLLLSSSANDHNMAVHKCLGLRMISKITKMNSLRFASQHLWTLESSPAFHWGTSGGNSFFPAGPFGAPSKKLRGDLGGNLAQSLGCAIQFPFEDVQSEIRLWLWLILDTLQDAIFGWVSNTHAHTYSHPQIENNIIKLGCTLPSVWGWLSLSLYVYMYLKLEHKYQYSRVHI